MFSIALRKTAVKPTPTSEFRFSYLVSVEGNLAGCVILREVWDGVPRMGAEERDGSLRFFEPADKTIVPHCLYPKTSAFALIDAGQRRNSQDI